MIATNTQIGHTPISRPSVNLLIWDVCKVSHVSLVPSILTQGMWMAMLDAFLALRDGRWLQLKKFR